MRIAVCCLVLFILAGLPASAKSADLTATQRLQLEGGGIVVLDVLPPGGSGQPSQGGTGVAIAHAPVEVVWRVLTDLPGHSGLYPRVREVNVLESGNEHSLVRYVIGVGPLSFGFHVHNVADQSRRRIEWTLARGRDNDLFRENWGYWQVEPDPRGTIVTYAIAARTVLPAFMTRGAEREGLIATLKAVCQRAEEMGAKVSALGRLRRSSGG
jgi:hypothetical protein